MKTRYQVSRAAIDLVKRFEGYRRVAARLPEGGWTIGYGHTASARQGAEVSEADAEALLLYDLIVTAKAVNEVVFTPLNQNQFDALCVFALGIGLPAFRRSSVLKRVNEGAFIQAAFSMELWRRAEIEGERIVLDALIRRRAAEKTLFLTPPGGAWPVAPAAVLKALLDADGFDLTPREAPAAVVATLRGDQITVRRDGGSTTTPLSTPSSGQDAGDSVVQAAAEQVSARLQTLFADARSEPPPPPPAKGASPTPPAQLIEEIEEARPTQHVLDSGVVLDAEPRHAPDHGAVFDDQHEAAAEPAPPVEPFYDYARVDGRRERAPSVSLMSISGLALPGLVFFGGGSFWGLNAHPAGVNGPVNPLMVGGLGALTGALLFGIAIYLLMQKIGGAAEDEGERA